jgi:hypothetical protein
MNVFVTLKSLLLEFYKLFKNSFLVWQTLTLAPTDAPLSTRSAKAMPTLTLS